MSLGQGNTRKDYNGVLGNKSEKLSLQFFKWIRNCICKDQRKWHCNALSSANFSCVQEIKKFGMRHSVLIDLIQPTTGQWFSTGHTEVLQEARWETGKNTELGDMAGQNLKAQDKSYQKGIPSPLWPDSEMFRWKKRWKFQA